MIVDVNAYHGTWPYWPLRGADIDSTLRAMDRLGIQRAFLSALKGVFADPEAGNAQTMEIVRAHPGRFLPALTYSPYAAGHDRFRSELADVGAALVKLFPLNHSYDPLEEPFIAELCDTCGEMHVPILIPHRIMMSWRMPQFPVEKIGTLAQRHANTTFIVGSINYLFELQTALHVMRNRPNVLLETSAMMAFEEIQSIVAQVGAGRLLHGTAQPLQIPAIGPLKIETADIPRVDKERILYRNAIKLFGGSEMI